MEEDERHFIYTKTYDRIVISSSTMSYVSDNDVVTIATPTITKREEVLRERWV